MLASIPDSSGDPGFDFGFGKSPSRCLRLPLPFRDLHRSRNFEATPWAGIPRVAGDTKDDVLVRRKHAGTAPASDHPAIPEPGFAERARTLLYLGRIGSLSTLSRKQPGFPFGSVMPYGLDDQGRPIFLISTMAMHTQNLQNDPSRQLACNPGGRRQ